MDLRAQAVIGEVLLVGLRAVGRVGPQVARGIVLRDEVRQLCAIVAGRVRCRPGPDQTMPPVDAYVRVLDLEPKVRAAGLSAELFPDGHYNPRLAAFIGEAVAG